jgi:uncharacterized membrane protein
MESKAKIMGHPIHPILIPFPLGLLSTSVVFDVVYLLTGNGKWSEISFWMIAAGAWWAIRAPTTLPRPRPAPSSCRGRNPPSRTGRSPR